jgi:hypothetical protein
VSIFVRDNFCPHDPAIGLYLLGTALSLPALKVAGLHHWTFFAWTLGLFVLLPAPLYVVRLLLERFDRELPDCVESMVEYHSIAVFLIGIVCLLVFLVMTVTRLIFHVSPL